MTGNGFSDPINPSLPTVDPNKPLSTTAVRVAAHSETATNTGNPVNRSMSAKPLGKLGIVGDGQQK